MDAAHVNWRPLGALLVDRGVLSPEDLERALAEQQRTGRKLGQVIVDLRLAPGTAITRALAEQSGLEVQTESGFGTGLWAAIEQRHGDRRPDPDGAPEGPATPGQGDEPEPSPSWRPLGELLVDAGVLTEETLELVLLEQERSGRRVGEIIVGLRLAAPETIARTLAEQWGIEHDGPDGRLAASLSAELARAEQPEPEPVAVAVVGAAAEGGRAGLADLAEDLERRMAELEELARALELHSERLDRLELLAGRSRDREVDTASALRELEAAAAAAELAGGLEGRVRALEESAAPGRAEPPAPIGDEPHAGPAHEAADGHLLFVASPGGYELRDREGPPPAVAAQIRLDGLGGSFLVSRLARSPLPGDRRSCAYLQATPGS